MKTKYLMRLAVLFTTLASLSSCAVVGGIFKTGMGVGAVIVIAVTCLIVFLINKSSKK